MPPVRHRAHCDGPSGDCPRNTSLQIARLPPWQQNKRLGIIRTPNSLIPLSQMEAHSRRQANPMHLLASHAPPWSPPTRLKVKPHRARSTHNRSHNTLSSCASRRRNTIKIRRVHLLQPTQRSSSKGQRTSLNSASATRARPFAFPRCQPL